MFHQHSQATEIDLAVIVVVKMYFSECLHTKRLNYILSYMTRSKGVYNSTHYCTGTLISTFCFIEGLSDMSMVKLSIPYSANIWLRPLRGCVDVTVM